MSTAALAALEAAKVAATAATAAAAAAFSASAAAAAASLAAAETAAAAAMDADCLAPFSNTAARGSTAISRANHGSGFAQTAASGPTTAAPLVASTAYAAAQAATAAAAAASAAASMAREAAVAAKSLCSAASLAASAAAAGPGSASWSEIALALAMGTHSRLGAESALRRLDSDALRSLMAHVTLHVPRDAPTLSTALRRAGPWQRVLIARGEHALCDAAPSARPLLLLGEPGAVLRGTLVLGSAGGEVRGLRCDDAGDCCVRVLGGKWRFSNCRLRCSHASALHVSCDAQVELVECTLGGESAHEMGSHVVHLSAYGSVQVAGLAKRACFALVAKQKAVVAARRSDLSQCSEAALLIGGRARALLEDCTISGAEAAFMSGVGRGRALELRTCSVRARRLWADADRPRVVGLHDTRAECADEAAAEAEAEAEAEAAAAAGVRGDDTSSEGSLEEPEFVDLERLMEELDESAISQAALP
uniref:Right handed beta helix domain-containing protein n=1 Tax=Chrysotila carterae TaxID=13221 RepID=A0A7S4EYF9_CHRCT